MPRFLILFLPLLVALSASLPVAWAQAVGALPCAQDPSLADCPEVAGRGAWGLIVLGVVFFSIWFMPPRRGAEKGVGFMDSLPIMGALQRRIDKELTGWRRFQWPLIGLFFMSLGVAFLFGWI